MVQKFQKWVLEFTWLIYKEVNEKMIFLWKTAKTRQLCNGTQVKKSSQNSNTSSKSFTLKIVKYCPRISGGKKSLKKRVLLTPKQPNQIVR